MNRTAILVILAALSVALGAATVWCAATRAGAEPEVRYDRESRYYRIRVVDYPDRGRRCLHFSKTRGVQSAMRLDAPVALELQYSRSMMAAFALVPEAKDVLLVGLGGASIPKFIQTHFPEVRLDVAELDMDVVKVCRTFFEFKGTPNVRVFVMDGRLYLKRAEKRYDLILLDAYASEYIPFHLTTIEFIRLVRDHLKPGGAVASNLWERNVNRFYHAELRTFQEVFPESYLFPSGTSGNVILFATRSPERVTKPEWAARARKIIQGKDLGFDLPELVGREYRVLTDQAIREKVLTDDMAPVNTLRHEHPKTFDKGPE